MFSTIRNPIHISMFCLIFSALLFCSCGPWSAQIQTQEPAPEIIGMANPASVFCEEQGFQSEIRTDAEGGQYGVCIFPDGRECEEWAFFRGECSPGIESDESSAEAESDATLPASEQAPPQGRISVTAWAGHVATTAESSEYDDYVSLMPEGAGEVGIAGATDDIEAEILSLRDATEVKETALFWGSLTCGIPDYGGCQLLVEQVHYGQFQKQDEVADWKGTVVCSHFNAEADAPCGNAFVLAGDFPVQFGIWSRDPALLEQLNSIRDSGTQVKVWGELLAGIPDVNGTQIQVVRMDVIPED